MVSSTFNNSSKLKYEKYQLECLLDATLDKQVKYTITSDNPNYKILFIKLNDSLYFEQVFRNESEFKDLDQLVFSRNTQYMIVQ